MGKTLMAFPNLGDYDGSFEHVACSDNRRKHSDYERWKQFFGNSSSEGCLKLTIEDHFKVYLHYGPTKDSITQLLAQGTTNRPSHWEAGWIQDFVTIKVPDEQRVFVDIPADQLNFGYFHGFAVRKNKTIVNQLKWMDGSKDLSLVLTWEGDSINLGIIRRNNKLNLNELILSRFNLL